MSESSRYIFIFWLISNVVSTMPSAEEVSAVGMAPGFVLLYRWAYNLLHLCVGNSAHVFPQLRLLTKEKTDD